jgi:hypothetical protein
MSVCVYSVFVLCVGSCLATGLIPPSTESYGLCIKCKGEDIPVTGHGGPWGCERSRLPHYLDIRVRDGGKVVSPTGRPPALYPQVSFLRFLVLISVRGRVDTRVIVLTEELRKLENIHLIGTRSRNLPVCSIVPQPLRYRVTPPSVY